MDLQVNWSRSAGVLIASPAGRVDGANSAAFREAVEAGVPSGERALLLDLGELSYMSSAGLRVLLMVARNFREPDQAMGVCSLSDAMRSLMALSGFDKIMPVYENRAAAIGTMSTEDDAAAASAAIRKSKSRQSVPEQLPNSRDMNTVKAAR